MSVKREWGETVGRLGSLGMSAVSIATAPLTGFAGLSWKSPNKTTTYQLLKADLILSAIVPIGVEESSCDEIKGRCLPLPSVGRNGKPNRVRL